MSGLGGALATGMAMGAGSEIAHQAIRGIMGSGSSGHGQAPPQQQQYAPMQAAPMQAAPVQYAQPVQQQQDPCMSFNTSFLQCLKQSSNDIGFCQSGMDMLTQCQKDNAAYYNSLSF